MIVQSYVVCIVKMMIFLFQVYYPKFVLNELAH